MAPSTLLARRATTLLAGAAAAIGLLTTLPGAARASSPCPIALPPAGIVQATAGRPVTVTEHACHPAGEMFSDVTFEWGDGSTSPGSVSYSSDAGSGFNVATFRATHTYGQAGGYPLAVSWLDQQTGVAGSDVVLDVSVSAPDAQGTQSAGDQPLSLPAGGVLVYRAAGQLTVSVPAMPAGSMLVVTTLHRVGRTRTLRRLASYRSSFSTLQVPAQSVIEVALRLVDPHDAALDSAVRRVRVSTN